jgi:hypothetical protein
MAERGRSGQAKRTKRQRDARAEVAAVVRLETAADCRAALERALAALEVSGADPVARANATARVVAAAVAVIKTVDLESEVAALRQLVIERIPEAADRLGTIGGNA